MKLDENELLKQWVDQYSCNENESVMFCSLGPNEKFQGKFSKWCIKVLESTNEKDLFSGFQTSLPHNGNTLELLNSFFSPK